MLLYHLAFTVNLFNSFEQINALQAQIDKDNEMLNLNLSNDEREKLKQRVGANTLEQAKITEQTADKQHISVNNYNHSFKAWKETIQENKCVEIEEITLFYGSRRAKEGKRVLLIHYSEEGIIDAIVCNSQESYKDFFFEYALNFENNFKCYFFK